MKRMRFNSDIKNCNPKQKSKMADGLISKKIAISPNGLTDFDEIWHDDANSSSRTPLTNRISGFFKIQDVGRPPS